MARLAPTGHTSGPGLHPSLKALAQGCENGPMNANATPELMNTLGQQAKAASAHMAKALGQKPTQPAPASTAPVTSSRRQESTNTLLTFQKNNTAMTVMAHTDMNAPSVVA